MVEDEALWEAFNSACLPEKEWTHDAHLRVAWMFSQRYSLNEAHVLMRVGIIRLNAFHGLVETAARGYHETITRVWLVLVRSLMKEHVAKTSAEFVTTGRASLAKQVLLDHYTKERLMSVEARARFIEPNVAPLPSLIVPELGP